MDQEPMGLEEKRLALDFERLKLDRQKARIELLLKRKELNAGKGKGWKDVLSNPLTLAIVGGFITLMTTTIAGHFSTLENINAETAKAKQALQADLIKKFVDNPSPQAVRSNLQFLVDVGLVPSYADNMRAYLKKTPDSGLPSTSTPGSSKLQDVHTPDDAIGLVMQMEGGFFQDKMVGAENFGITVRELSSYLGKTASVEDLKNLSIETARDLYRKNYLTGPAAQIASVQVTAAYLSLASNMGKHQADKIFQAAVGKIDGLPINDNGELSLAIVQRMNAVDANLLIETANCGAAKFYEGLPNFHMFGQAWLRRLRIFSPATLKGICPELSGTATDGAGTAAQP